MKKCHFPDCKEEKIYARGVCPKHFNLMRKAVAKKNRTWDEFIKAGYCLEAKNGRNTPISIDFYKKLEKLPKRVASVSHEKLPVITA